MNFYFLAPYLETEIGHQYVYHKALEKIVQELDLNYQVLVSKTCQVTLTAPWSPFFKNSESKWTKIIFRFFDWKKLLSSKGSSRIFFQENFNTADLIGLASAFFLFSKKSDSLWLLYRNDMKSAWMQGKWLVFFSWLLKKKFKERFVALTDSDLIAHEIKSRIRTEPIVVPIPHAEEVLKIQEKKDIPIFWWPGDPRDEKGWEVIRRLTSLKAPQGMELMAAKKSGLEEKSGAIAIKLLDTVLTREEYLKWMGHADILLLPYDPIAYRMRTSGLLIEAVMFGKIPLVKKGGWLSAELKKYDLEALIVDWEDPQFFWNVYKIWLDKDIAAKLKCMRQSYAKFHNIETYTKIINDLSRL